MNDTVIQFEGTVYEQGYGLIAQKVMRDKDLHPVSKSIYAYLCSFAGANGKDGERTAFPGVPLMMAELGIKTDDTYYKYRKALLQKGYIKIEKRRQQGAKFDNNLYKIIAVPVELPKEEAKKPDKQEEKEPHPKLSGTGEPYPKLSSTAEPSTVESGTNITRSTIISSTITEEEEEASAPQMVIELFKENFKTSNASIEKELTEWTSKLPVEVICNEISFAAINGAEKFSYLQKAFTEDLLLGVDSIEKLETKRNDFRLAQKKGSAKKSSNHRNKPAREEKLPKWFIDSQKESQEREQASEHEKQHSSSAEQLEKEKQEVLARIAAKTAQIKKYQK